MEKSGSMLVSLLVSDAAESPIGSTNFFFSFQFDSKNFRGCDWQRIFRASFVHLTRRRAASLFSYAKPNKQVSVFTATSFDGYQPEGREFESPRAHHSYPLFHLRGFLRFNRHDIL
jgi:hypothetical protein